VTCDETGGNREAGSTTRDWKDLAVIP
jgi:hypothetical protein